MINLSSIENYKLSSSQVKNIIKLKNTHKWAEDGYGDSGLVDMGFEENKA